MAREDIDLAGQLRAALASSMRSGDKGATAALRAALADMANAEAVPVDSGAPGPAADEHFAGSSRGLGAAEAPRRPLSEAAARIIVEQEAAARRASALQFRAQGRIDEAADLARGARALGAALDPS
jgi:uncharacterized protein YqeY